MSMRLCGFGSTPADMTLESLHELCIGTKPSGPIFQEIICDLLHMIYHKNKCCLARYFFEVLSPPSPNLRVLGKLGPSKSSPSKLGPDLAASWAVDFLVPRQIGPRQIGSRPIGPLYYIFICIGYILPTIGEYMSFEFKQGGIYYWSALKND